MVAENNPLLLREAASDRPPRGPPRTQGQPLEGEALERREERGAGAAAAERRGHRHVGQIDRLAVGGDAEGGGVLAPRLRRERHLAGAHERGVARGAAGGARPLEHADEAGGDVRRGGEDLGHVAGDPPPEEPPAGGSDWGPGGAREAPLQDHGAPRERTWGSPGVLRLAISSKQSKQSESNGGSVWSAHWYSGAPIEVEKDSARRSVTGSRSAGVKRRIATRAPSFKVACVPGRRVLLSGRGGGECTG